MTVVCNCSPKVALTTKSGTRFVFACLFWCGSSFSDGGGGGGDQVKKGTITFEGEGVRTPWTPTPPLDPPHLLMQHLILSQELYTHGLG